ncbi:hypothetical protein ACHAQA_003815 [Verticillium albo-atrum]
MDKRPASTDDPALMARQPDNERPPLPDKVPIGTLRHVNNTILPREYQPYLPQIDDAGDGRSRSEDHSANNDVNTVGLTKINNNQNDNPHSQAPPLPARNVDGLKRQHSGHLAGVLRVDSFKDSGDSDLDSQRVTRARSPNPPAEDHASEQDNERKIMMETMGALNSQIRSLTVRVEIAEEKRKRAELALEERIKTGSDLNDMLKSAEKLTTDMERTRTENGELKDQLRDAQSHIFSLQPYRKDITPEEVGRQYTNLIESISDWVSKFMEPWLDNHQESLEMLSTGLQSDEDVVVSLILRTLNDKIFQKTLYDAVSTVTDMLDGIEKSMREHVEPRRGQYKFILCISPLRESKEKQLTRELVGLLSIFCSRGQMEAFHDGFLHNCVRPAMKLHEKILLSTHHFYLDHTQYIVWARNNTGDLELSPSFLEHLDNLDCKNVVQNRKTFNPRKLNPEPTKTELYHNLENVCTVAPALYMRQIGRLDTIKDPELVRKQQMLVAWGSEEKRIKYKKNGDQTLLGLIYSANEREGWANFRWT